MRSTSEEVIKKMNWARWIARILSSLTAFLWGWWFIGSLIPKYLDKGRAFIPTSGELAVIIFFIIVLAGTIIGWWNEKWGGIVLIVGYLTNAIGGYILALSSHIAVAFVPVIIFIPFLICGILYIIYWGKNRNLIKASG